jgi:hypothetical protein
MFRPRELIFRLDSDTQALLREGLGELHAIRVALESGIWSPEQLQRLDGLIKRIDEIDKKEPPIQKGT